MDAPEAYKNAGLANLVGGIFGAMANSVIGLTFLMMCIGVFWIVPFGASLWQAYVGYQMYQGQAVGSAKMAAIAGIVSGLFGLNPIAIIAGIFAMMQVNQPDVAGWLEARA